MLIIRMPPGESATIDDIALIVSEVADGRVRVTVNAPQSVRVRLMPEDVVVPSRITAWRAMSEQIHIESDVQVWILGTSGNRARIGILADEHRRVARERCVTETNRDF